MAVHKPTIPKGTRDFGPLEMTRRNYIFDIIRGVFQEYAFQQIETPAMENLSTLMGKYGEEGDKLLFKILNSGDFTRGIYPADFNTGNLGKLIPKVAKRGLRYDLTVPFARFVVQHRNELTFPFRRYQLQPVWRADNPQKGRYREFYQCDADMIGSESLLNEFELVHIIDKVFSQLNLACTIKINNRKVLAGISEIIGEAEKIVDITVAIDKLDKIGREKVREELLVKGIGDEAVKKLEPVFEMKGTSEKKLNFLDHYLKDSPTGLLGVRELKTLLGYLDHDPVEKVGIEIDITLARGLDYYTGAIFEVKSNEVSIGSICGGGRYDDLTGVFGMPDVSGVGISFGADRIYDVLLQLDRFPESVDDKTRLLFVNFGEKEVHFILPLLHQIRKAGIKAELYPDNVKMKKQMTYANQSDIPYVALVGEEEMKSGIVTLKNMLSGEQERLSPEDLVQLLSS